MDVSFQFSIIIVIFTLLAQMACGIPLAALCAGRIGGNAALRGALIRQCLAALIFVGAAGFLAIVHPDLPLHVRLQMAQPDHSLLGREIALLFVTFLALAGAVWLNKPPAHTSLVEGLLATAALAGMVLLYVMAKAFDLPTFTALEANACFFVFLGSALALGSFWQGMALCLKREAEPEQIHRAMWTLFFLALGGFILLAAFAPLSLPAPANRQALRQHIEICQGLQTCLGGCGIFLFCIVLWKCQHNKGAGAWMLGALILAIGGEVAGRCAFFLGHGGM